ncbi:MAG: sugar phosphate isomerase/epimerase [Alistipes sp.]|nr:sugar phosphate isomerase/epimerase [Alistipes sp.]
MKQFLLSLVALLTVACTSKEVMITPTTEVAPEGACTKGLRYYPGISIGVMMENYADYLTQIAEAGFKYIEISIAHKSGFADMTDEEALAVLTTKREQAAAVGLTVWSIHLPFESTVWTNIGGEESIRRQSVDNIMRVLRLCNQAIPECKNYVLHASKGTLDPRSESVLQARKSLAEMLPVAKEYGVRLCVENLVGSLCPTIEEMGDTIEGIEDAWVTYDIGHANCVGIDVIEFLKFIGPRLGTVHMHDTMFATRVDDHRIVGQGNVNRWGEVYKTLLEDNRYRGVFMFELGGNDPKEVMATYYDIILKQYTELTK